VQARVFPLTRPRAKDAATGGIGRYDLTGEIRIVRSLIFPIAIAASFIGGCSNDDSSQSPRSEVAAEATAAADAAVPQQRRLATRNGWAPNEACSFLEPTLVTRGYKHNFGDEYHCFSPYKDIGHSDLLENNLAYYVTGEANLADAVKLVLNYNQPTSAAPATDQLVAASKTLSLKATGGDLPPAIFTALAAGRSAVEISGAFQHEVKRKDWPTGRGYETHYIVTKLVER
jgi:hypothetical protein